MADTPCSVAARRSPICLPPDEGPIIIIHFHDGRDEAEGPSSWVSYLSLPSGERESLDLWRHEEQGVCQPNRPN